MLKKWRKTLNQPEIRDERSKADVLSECQKKSQNNEKSVKMLRVILTYNFKKQDKKKKGQEN